jgi:hypothetical protein
MDLKKLIAELKAEGRIVEAKGKWPGIHAGILEPPHGAPPATGGAAQVARFVDRRGPVKKPAHVD